MKTQKGKKNNSSPRNFLMVDWFFVREEIDSKLQSPLAPILNYIVNYNLDTSKVSQNNSVHLAPEVAITG